MNFQKASKNFSVKCPRYFGEVPPEFRSSAPDISVKYPQVSNERLVVTGLTADSATLIY